jgi:hypothetical protein
MTSNRRKLLFFCSLCLASYGVGTVTAWQQVFPFTVVRDATAAARAYLQVYAPEDRLVDRELSAPTIRRPLTADDGRRLLVAGGVDFLSGESSTGHTLAWIMDRQGTIEHIWEYDPAIWSDLQHVEAAPLKSEVYPVGLHLFADGSLLASFQGKNCWPYAIGMAKFDRDSRLLWKKELLSHHWFSVGEDGRIYTGAMRITNSPVRLGETAAEITSPDGRITEDVILVLDSNGDLLDEIPVLPALIEGGWIGLFQGATDDNINARTGDPTHLNDVRVVSASEAAGSDRLSPGDLLVSFRSLNAVGLLDPSTRQFKWMHAGAAIRQHCPRIVNGEVLLLDNRGGPVSTGGSRLVAIDLQSGLPRTAFPRHASTDFTHPFFTNVAGHIDLLTPTRVLTTLTSRSEIWEVDLESSEVLWEYVYVDPQTRERRPLYTAKYVNEADFPFNRSREVSP